MSPRDVAMLLPPKENFASERMGAIALVVRDLARAGQPAWRATVLGSKPTGEVPGDLAFHAIGRSLPWPPGRAARYAAAAADRLRRAALPRLVEVHNRPLVALGLKRRMGALPVVLVLHNDPHGMAEAGSARERLRLLRALDGVVTISHWLRLRLLDGIDPASPEAARVAALWSGLPARPCATPEPDAPRQQRILFLGRVCRDKGADSFVSACALALPRLPGWSAAIIGADRFAPDSPDTAFLAGLRPMAERAGVELLGYHPNDEALAMIGVASIVVVPSRWPEPFARVAVEAQAAGAALIASRRGGLPEAAGDDALYADPDDPQALAEAIVALARDPDRRDRMARTGQARARDVFGMAAAAARWDGFRSAVLAGRR